MSKLANISCVSHTPPALTADTKYDCVVGTMINHWQERLESILTDDPDIIVLPEHCDYPNVEPSTSDWRRDFLTHRGNTIRDFFAEIAAKNRTYVAYSAHRLTTDGSIYNSLQMIDRQGAVVGTYDKIFLTPSELDRGLRLGEELVVFDLDFGRVAPAICFDMHFEELRTARAQQRPDLILFSSAYHGGLVQAAWAFQSRAYFAGSVLPPSPSSIISPVGDLLGESINYRHDVTRTVNFDAAVLARPPNVEKFGRVKQRYRTKVRIHNPGRLGAVLLTSESDDFTVDAVIEEFDLERIDDYYDRGRIDRSQRARPFRTP